MAAFSTDDQVGDGVTSAQGITANLPNFVGELFRLSPMETPLLSLIGGLTGGESLQAPVFTWQDTIHRAPAIQDVAEGADAIYVAQKRAERRNVATVHQYGVELSYTKQAATGLTGSGGGEPQDLATTQTTVPAIDSTNVLGNQPVQDEMSWQLQIKVEQAALDVEVLFLKGIYAWPDDGTARQTAGIETVIALPTLLDQVLVALQPFDRSIVNALAQALFDNGAPMRNSVIMVGSLEKLDLGNSYQTEGSGGWNVQPRSYNMFGVNVTDIETEFGGFPVVLNRHLTADSAMIIDLDVMSPCFLPIQGKGHFFLEPLAKLGSYDREQLYGEIGLKYGPVGWHARATNLHEVI